MPAQLRRIDGDATPLAMFDRLVAGRGDAPLLFSHGTPITAERVAGLVDGLAGGLAGLGVERGDRVALHLQNDPHFVIAMLAVWRLGAIAVPCSPMLRDRELAKQLHDSGATVVVTLDELFAEVGATAVGLAGGVRRVVAGAPGDFCADPDVDWPLVAHEAGAVRFLDLATGLGLPPDAAAAAPAPDDVAVLTYTSGTTGPAKGAASTHGNISQASRIYRECLGVGTADVILGIAPLYHVTGLSGHIGLALASGAPLVLAHRFDAAVTCRLIERHRATVTIAAITAYVALANHEASTQHDLSSLRGAFSGGAPIAPATVRELRERTGLVIQPVYGLTETTGPTHISLPGMTPPVHAGTGALAVGLTVPETRTRILDEHGAPVPAGAAGEVAVSGGQVVPGYWGRPDESARAFHAGELRTGDVGIVDADGWLYLVDRIKDMIIASGFKVWPREVEDVLYEHEAVREAAAIGVPDGYRGETVWAYVSLKAGHQVTADALIAHCRTRLASYKYPRVVRIIDELPKTQSGKILRRELRTWPEHDPVR